MQVKDIPDELILETMKKIRKPRDSWVNLFDIQEALPNIPPKVILAKLRNMCNRDVVDGCCCGCSGGFIICGLDYV